MKYQNIKKQIRSLWAQQKSGAMGTGGGLSDAPGKYDAYVNSEEKKELAALINLTVVGLGAEFDSDRKYAGAIAQSKNKENENTQKQCTQNKNTQQSESGTTVAEVNSNAAELVYHFADDDPLFDDDMENFAGFEMLAEGDNVPTSLFFASPIAVASTTSPGVGVASTSSGITSSRIAHTITSQPEPATAATSTPEAEAVGGMSTPSGQVAKIEVFKEEPPENKLWVNCARRLLKSKKHPVLQAKRKPEQQQQNEVETKRVRAYEEAALHASETRQQKSRIASMCIGTCRNRKTSRRNCIGTRQSSARTRESATTIDEIKNKSAGEKNGSGMFFVVVVVGQRGRRWLGRRNRSQHLPELT